ncbi:MAG: VWA domain-containing protein [Bdellovibrionota bacterium]
MTTALDAQRARSARPKQVVVWILALIMFIGGSLHLLAPSSIAEDSPKKKTSSEKRGKSKGKKDDFEKVEPETAIGADSRISAKQFDADAAQLGKVDAVLVIDSSRSMQRTDPARLRDQAAKLFIRFLGEGDRIAILQFDRDVKTIVPLSEVNQANLSNLDKAITDIPVEGGFTDLEAAVEEAMKVLVTNARNDSQRTVVLLSDGKMDPHPSRGTSAEMTQKVKEVELPQYHEKNIKLYTLAFSEEADKALLADFAKDTGGLSWYAPDPSTIHKKFSELFLTLKRPQVVPLEGAGFEIDSSVQEATFYITRKEGDKEVVLVDPRGTEISALSMPAGVKWFSGNMFEVITIAKPFPGRWAVKGVETAEGFATLLSDIKLQVRWPQSSFKLGDSVVIYARLTNGGEEMSKPGLDEITFYTYKVINGENGASWLSGALNDKGENGDAKAADGIYSTTLKLDKEGEYQGLFAVTSPTFTREQRISFSVAGSLVSLRITPPDDFTGTPERVQAVLSKDPGQFKSLKVQLVAKKKDEEKPVGLTLKSGKEDPAVFDIPTEKLKPGEYELYVKVTGVDERKKAVSGSSETIQYSVAHKEGEPDASGEVEELDDHPAETHSNLVVGLISILLSIAWLGGLAFLGLKKVSANKSQIEERKPYVIPPELAQRIEVVKTTASETRRKPSAVDREVFALVGDVFQAEPGDAARAEGEPTPEPEQDA